MAALSIALALALPACNNQSGFSGAVGNTPNGPRLASYEIVGTIGTPFTATVANQRFVVDVSGQRPALRLHLQ